MKSTLLLETLGTENGLRPLVWVAEPIPTKRQVLWPQCYRILCSSLVVFLTKFVQFFDVSVFNGAWMHVHVSATTVSRRPFFASCISVL